MGMLQGEKAQPCKECVPYASFDPLFKGVQHAFRPDRRFYPRPTVVDRSCLRSLWHSRRDWVRRSFHHASTFLRPFAPRKLLRFDATMNALTPVRLAPCRRGLGQCLPWYPPFRAAWQMGTRPCQFRPAIHPRPGQVSWLHVPGLVPTFRLQSPEVPGHRVRVLSCSRDRLPPPSPCGDSRVLGLRHSTAGSPPPTGRIEFVSYGPSVHFRLLPTSPPGNAVTFSYKSENLDLEGTFTPRTQYTHHRTVDPQLAVEF